MKVQVQNMVSSNGNCVPNQFEIFTKTAKYFQSYSKVIAKIRLKDRQVYLDKNYWDYSIETGEYKLVDLNK
jgi:hypothetical protein